MSLRGPAVCSWTSLTPLPSPTTVRPCWEGVTVIAGGREGCGGSFWLPYAVVPPMTGEGVGRREDVHAEPHQETAAGPPGGRASEETEADRVKGEGAAEGEEAAAE